MNLESENFCKKHVRVLYYFSAALFFMNWDDFSHFYDWEFQLFCTEQQKDVVLWRDLAAKYGDPILELACGSGRITIPLAERSYEITAVDYSEKMLQILRSKAKNLNNIISLKASMTNFKINSKFAFAFISYSSFQQLLTVDEQIQCLKNIHNHLIEGGILALDIGTHICEGNDQNEYRHLYTAEYPMNNSTVSMFTSFTTDREKKIRTWQDKYLQVHADGSSEIFYNKIALMECDEAYMRGLLKKTGFRIINLFGSFEGGELQDESNNAIYIAKKIS